MHDKEQEFIGLIRELLAVPAPSGREDLASAVVKRHLDRLGYFHKTDGAGNVFVRLAGRDPGGPSCIFAAHLDEVGLVVTKVEADGTLLVNRSGKVSPHKFGERPVVVLGDSGSIRGVVSFGSGHTAGGNEGLAWEDARVITGLTTDALFGFGIRQGSPAVPTAEGRELLLLGEPDDPLVGAWTLDDRAGVAVLLQLLSKLKHDSIQPSSRK